MKYSVQMKYHMGLPGENYDSFRLSFNDVYNLEPEQLQLGL